MTKAPRLNREFVIADVAGAFVALTPAAALTKP
jgi:hypothetical protein